jgi:outer membrane protein TolC
MRIEACLLPLLLSACASTGIDRAPLQPDRPWVPHTDADGGLSVRSADAVVQQHGFTLPANPSVDLPGGAAPVTGKRYALADLIDLAQELNPETRIAWNQARDAALAAGIARSAYLPRLTASVLAGAQSEHGGGAALGQSIDPRNRANGSLAVLSLQWLLFDFGQREALVTVADQHTVIANIQFTQAHQRLIHAVSLAFLRHATARTRMDATTAAQADAKGLLAAAQARLQHGQGTVMDVAQARQQVAQAALEQVAAQGEREEAYQQLLATIGISPLATLEIADAPARPVSHVDEALLDDVVRSALQRRPDVLAAVAAQQAASAGVRAARADFLPRLFVSVSGSRSNGDMDISAVPSVGEQAPTVNLSSHRWSSSLLLGVSVPLYSGGERNARLAQARNRAAMAADSLDRVKLDAVAEIVAAHSRLRTRLQATHAAQALLEASQLAHDAASAAYQRGVGSLTDVLAADRQLLQARISVADADGAARAASVDLALACGNLGTAPGQGD